MKFKEDYLEAREDTKVTAKYALYNIKKDLGQRNNVMDQYPEIKKKLQAMLNQARSKRN